MNLKKISSPIWITKKINRLLLEKIKAKLELGFVIPTLRHEAWNMIIANQTATYIGGISLATIMC
ncbi:hypothetical protein ACO0LM_22410 [Undibacterium sp. Di26W]|uniref:hypothetical protein n=1 Tax=Undibacterium sp. Di26W TaxID=3413035 RepID=UPI003BF26D8B